MEGKVQKMYSESQTAYKEKVYSRIVSGNMNFSNFLTSPLFGIGRFFEVEDEENTGNNGTTLLLAEFGLIGFGFYMICMYLSYKNYCESLNFNLKYPFIVVASLLVLGYSQGIFQKPFFIGLSFMYLVKHNAFLSFGVKNFKFENINMVSKLNNAKSRLIYDGN